MPLILSKPTAKLEKLRFKISSDLLAEVKAYCEAFSIKEMEDFFLQAAQYVLKNDRDWVKLNRKKLEEK